MGSRPDPSGVFIRHTASSDERDIMVQFTVNAHADVARLAGLLHRASVEEVDPDVAATWKRLARICRTGQSTYNPRTPRPVKVEDERDDIARVVRGVAPYPVLSHEGALAAVAQMIRVRPRISDAVMAERLHVTERTAQRYRSIIRRRQEAT